MRLSTYIVAVATSLLVFASCGIAAKVNARNDLEQSKAAYKECLSQHVNETNQCAGQREANQTDLQTYETMSRGIRPGPSVFG